MNILVHWYDQYRVNVRSPGAIESCLQAHTEDWCPQCLCRPSHGHAVDCPHVVEATSQGAQLVPV